MPYCSSSWMSTEAWGLKGSKPVGKSAARTLNGMAQTTGYTRSCSGTAGGSRAMPGRPSGGSSGAPPGIVSRPSGRKRFSDSTGGAGRGGGVSASLTKSMSASKSAAGHWSYGTSKASTPMFAL